MSVLRDSRPATFRIRKPEPCSSDLQVADEMTPAEFELRSRLMEGIGEGSKT